MYQIIVNSSGWDDSGGKIDVSRIFECTDDDLLQKFKPDGKINVNDLKYIPTIFVSETGSKANSKIR